MDLDLVLDLDLNLRLGFKGGGMKHDEMGTGLMMCMNTYREGEKVKKSERGGEVKEEEKEEKEEDENY